MSIFKCSSPPKTPVYERSVDPSSLVFSLASPLLIIFLPKSYFSLSFFLCWFVSSRSGKSCPIYLIVYRWNLLPIYLQRWILQSCRWGTNWKLNKTRKILEGHLTGFGGNPYRPPWEHLSVMEWYFDLSTKSSTVNPLPGHYFSIPVSYPIPEQHVMIHHNISLSLETCHHTTLPRTMSPSLPWNDYFLSFYCWVTLNTLPNMLVEKL